MSVPPDLPLLLDGGTGTALLAAGMPKGCCTEEWVLQHPQALLELQKAYADAGAQAVLTPTFGASAPALGRFGRAQLVREYNLRLAELSRRAVGSRVLLGGDLGPAGLTCAPFGETPFLELVAAYAEQALILKEAGVDFIFCETMLSLTEARAAFLGARQTGLPVMVSMLLNEQGKTFSGGDPLAALVSLQRLGAAAFGFNCSAGPHAVLEALQAVEPYAVTPLIAKPSAGLPGVEPGYLSPEAMAGWTEKLFLSGARVLGGCCGSGPEHIRAMGQALHALPAAPVPYHDDNIIASTETEAFFLNEDLETSEPVECSVDMADALLAAAEPGCDAVCIHLKSVDDAHEFAGNAHLLHLPPAFLAETEEALESALIHYQGRAVIDSRSEVERDVLEALAQGYGALLF
ncbi:MAG: homocysteine S-methyltransferase family protein [Oscillospiraceae bacterium]|nr:homocysteine S-methyltransferase family protein [Oscillospiraceae bacterium]